MVRKMLIPLDGSSLSEAVLPVAEGLVGRLGAQVLLLQVVPQRVLTVPEGVTLTAKHLEALQELEKEDERTAESYLASVAGRFTEKGVQVAWEVRRGEPAEEIIRCAGERGADLIALSTHGRSGLPRLLLGSVAERVIKQAGIPVLVVKPS